MNIISIYNSISDGERAEILFRGDILIYRKVQAIQALLAYSDKLLKEALEGLEPTTAQAQLSADDFLVKTGRAQTIFRQSEHARQLFFAVLAECGLDLNNTYYDHFPMRIVPYDNTHQGAHTAAIGHHRDTWGSNIHSQMNWWAPLYSLEQERTIAMYPNYWQQPVANNTDSWRFEEYLAERKKGSRERMSAYPSAPSPLENVDESAVVKVVLQPGDILNFASAHLHASVPNTTQATRFSVEMRTINIADINAGRQALNVDNAADNPMYQWFKSVTGKHSLNDALLATESD